MEVETQPIFIPSTARGRLIQEFPQSVRLFNVLRNARIKLAGDLHGRSFADIARSRNCGKKTIDELREIVRALQRSSPETVSFSWPRHSPNILVVPPSVREISLREIPLSVRLGHVLRSRSYKSLGDLHGTDVYDLLKIENCGRKSISELRQLLRRAEAGEFTASPPVDFSEALVMIIRTIDAGVRELSARDRKIMDERLFGNEGESRTLEDVGRDFGMTRERVRQIVRGAFEKIRRAGGPVLARSLEAVADDCNTHVVPLTVSLLVERLPAGGATGERDPLFYVLVLDHMAQSIPAWPPGTTREGADNPQTEPVHQALEDWLRLSGDKPTAKEAWEHLRTQPRFAELSASDFLTILRRVRNLIVDFPHADEPRLRLRRLRLFDVTLPVLNESSEPLTPEEIIRRARSRFGANAVMLSARTAENALSAYPEVFRLGPRSFGLRKHFISAEPERLDLRNRFASLLRKENRPISTIEVCDKRNIAISSGLNAYELAEILREDNRFIDLGRRLFALAEWGVEEREHVKDLLPLILAEANRPLTVSDIYERLTKFRSATLPGLSNILRQHPQIRSFGFSFHGLRVWGDSRNAYLVGKRSIVEQAVRRAEPPIRFASLCEVFDIPVEGTAAATLWKSCAGSEKLRRAPDRRDPGTLLMHKTVSLEQCLASICRPIGRPVPAYELEWELRKRFGELFERVRLKQIEERLAKSPRFLRNTDGAYFLDADLDLESLDVEALRTAAIKALAIEREILSSDELIERLELQGFDVEEMSSGMLASILRGNEALQEVGHRRFRAK
ncbi:MAG: hypothetical protein M3Q89_04900 [Verrucomicrobiota bacterium]|nr:hypothetical protein [Verrucomicrobiota bacterium]